MTSEVSEVGGLWPNKGASNQTITNNYRDIPWTSQWKISPSTITSINSTLLCLHDTGAGQQSRSISLSRCTTWKRKSQVPLLLTTDPVQQANKQRYLRKIPRKLKVLFHTHFYSHFFSLNHLSTYLIKYSQSTTLHIWQRIMFHIFPFLNEMCLQHLDHFSASIILFFRSKSSDDFADKKKTEAEE